MREAYGLRFSKTARCLAFYGLLLSLGLHPTGEKILRWLTPWKFRHHAGFMGFHRYEFRAFSKD